MQFVAPLVFVGFLLVMFMAFRGQQRRQRELTHMQATLEVGDEVMLTSGVFGTLVSVDDDRVGLEVADGVVLQVVRGAIGEVLVTGDDEETPDALSESSADPSTTPMPITPQTTTPIAPTTPATVDTTRDADVSEEN